MVQSLYWLPGVSLSVVRSTTWPENGSSLNIQSKADRSFLGGTFQAMSAPGARLVAMSVWRTRRIVPASSIAPMRSITVASGTPAASAISFKGNA